MLRVTLRFYAELNDFLPRALRSKPISRELWLPTTTKDLIESCGVPHPEVDLILVNGVSVDFNYHVSDSDQVSVYPVFESLDITPLTRLQERPLRNPKFSVDEHLGKLARNLRLLGFDALYHNPAGDRWILEISRQQQRTLLTRDRQLLMHNQVQRGLWIRSQHHELQTREVLTRLDLATKCKPFTRCLHCNGLLETVDKTRIADRLEPLTQRYYEEFQRCGICDRIYWRGSHFTKIRSLVGRILRPAE